MVNHHIIAVYNVTAFTGTCKYGGPASICSQMAVTLGFRVPFKTEKMSTYEWIGPKHTTAADAVLQQPVGHNTLNKHSCLLFTYKVLMWLFSRGNFRLQCRGPDYFIK